MGVRFSHESPVFAEIAQLVEHLSEEQGVGGSIPSLGTRIFFSSVSSMVEQSADNR